MPTTSDANWSPVEDGKITAIRVTFDARPFAPQGDQRVAYRPRVLIMAMWKDFIEGAPHIATIFNRRHAATGNLCLLATLRSDGFPRISPMEPRVFEDQLLLGGMPGTTKFKDLERDPRFCLHTATIDTGVKDGDAKLWGVVRDIQDKVLHRRFARALYEETGFDLRGQVFDHFYAADLIGASAVEVAGGHMDVTIWKPGEPERVIRKH